METGLFINKIIMKKTFKVIGISLIVLIFAIMAFFGYVYWQVKTGRLIFWDGQWYTKEQIREKVGPQVYHVESKNTPEEVYAKFREALLKGDTEKALLEMRKEVRSEWREVFKDKEKFDKWVKTLPEKITKEEELGNFSTYHIDYGTKNRNTVDFIKDEQGYWQIDAI